MGWIHVGNDCTPRTFTLQAFTPDDVMANTLQNPRLSLTSGSGNFSFLTGTLLGANLYFRVSSVNAEGRTCASDSLAQYYDFSNIIQDGM